MGTTTDQFSPTQRVRVTQQIPYPRRVWTTQIEGEVVRYEQRKTGSWYAHAKDDKLWLDRLVLKKDDGEIVTLNLDNFVHVEAIGAPKTAKAAEAQPAKEAE